MRRKIEDDENKHKRDSYDEANSALMSSINQENNRFVKDQRLQTQQLIREQDKSVEQLGVAVDRLGEIGKTINTEVKEQAVLLDKLEEEVDEASSKMNAVEAALSKLLKTKDSCQIWTVVILAVILVLLSKSHCFTSSLLLLTKSHYYFFFLLFSSRLGHLDIKFCSYNTLLSLSKFTVIQSHSSCNELYLSLCAMTLL